MNKKPFSISITKSEKIGFDKLIDLALKHNKVRITHNGKGVAFVVTLGEADIQPSKDTWHQTN
jgi:hypothetical protein